MTWSVAAGEAHYSVSPNSGVRFVVLDTVADNSSSGNVDDAQFRWLAEQLVAAGARRELVLVFAHHSLRTLNGPGTNVRDQIGQEACGGW